MTEHATTQADAHADAHAEHFEDADQQAHAARFGMWVFLGSETLLFAGLFALYVGYRSMYPAEFDAASHENNMYIGTANTAILLVSSFAVAWAIHAMRHGRRRIAAYSLAATFLLGATFLVLKGFEYSHHFSEGIYPAIYYRHETLDGPGVRLFFTLYYFMTGLHALHVLGGLVMLATVFVLVWRGHFSPARHTALENVGLYWHLVDIIWLFLWPLLYLVG
jgi:cytochrome c oxidase subunit III